MGSRAFFAILIVLMILCAVFLIAVYNPPDYGIHYFSKYRQSKASENRFNCSHLVKSCNLTFLVPTVSSIPISSNRAPITADNDTNYKYKMEELIPKLESLAQSINKAKQHVRGTKTGDALIAAKKTIQQALSIVGRNWKTVTARPISDSENVCPERFVGYMYGSPYYETGHVFTKCKYSKQISELITIATVWDTSMTFNQSLTNLLKAIRIYDKNIPIVLSTPSLLMSGMEFYSNKYPNITFIDSKYKKLAIIWNQLLRKVKTPYVLIARNVTWFNRDARLHRLILEIDRLNVSTAGGASRDANGRWVDGCQQRAFRNNTLVYESGYDVSLDECIFCDQIDGPFVIKTEEAKNVKFNEEITKEGLFEDFFLRLNKKEHVVCPDSMFFVNRPDTSLNMSDWIEFANIWKVKKIKLSGKDINFPCKSGYSCKFGSTVSPCCQKEQSDLVNTAMNMCKKLGVVCELDSGTLLGVLKLHTIAPWEVDADTFFVSLNYSILNSSKELFSNAGYSLSVERPHRALKCCYKNTTRPYQGFFALRSRNWRLEYNGMPYLTSEERSMNGWPPTLLSLDGNWVRVPRNPGLVARNSYGKEIFQHSLHGSESKIGNYPKFFLPCSKPGHHACLDRYNTDGNIQFGDPIP